MLSALDPTRKAGGQVGGGGGEGVLPASGPIQKAGGGGAVRFRPDKKSGGGGGVLPASGPIRKAGGGGGGGGGGVCAVHLRPDTKSGGGVLSSASGPIQKAGKGEGLFSRRGGVTIYERRGCNPQNSPPWIRLWALKCKNGSSHSCTAMQLLN